MPVQQSTRPHPATPGPLPRRVHPFTSLLERLSVKRRLSWVLVVGLAAVYGELASEWTPRGPLSALQAVLSLGLGLLVGLVAGALTRSRWAMLVAPAMFVASFELGRLDVVGPTVDSIHLESTYGIMALVVGRGVHAVIVLVPMILGASLGAGLARRSWPSARKPSGAVHLLGLILRRTAAGMTALALVAIAVLVARPAATDAILDGDGRPVAGSVAELTRVTVNGHDLSLMIRGRDVHDPVLLFLAGGPGGSELGAMRRHSQGLENLFVVATLDQRGTGKSYDQQDPSSTLTVDAAVDDVVDVTHYLVDRFEQDRVYLVGQSWGSLLGVLAAHREPQLFRAFVGVGQMVSPAETDRVFYRDTLDWARQTGKENLVQQLTELGEPPYSAVLDYETALSYEQEVYPYDHSLNSEGSGQMAENIFVEEYTLLEQVHILAGFLDTFALLYPQLQEIDLRTDARVLEVPVFLAEGAHEAPGRALPAREWFGSLEAPDKQLVYFDTSGHRPLWEQPDEFTAFMTDTVLHRTSP